MAASNPEGTVSPLISSSELESRLKTGNAPIMIDVREVEEFHAGHIPGSINMPLSSFQGLFPRIPQDQEVVLVCRSDNRSGMAQQFLRARGWSNTRNLVGGMLSWRGPVE